MKEQRQRERVRISNIQKGKERRRGKRGEIEGKERVSGRGERNREETERRDISVRWRERDKGEETAEDGQRGGIEVENRPEIEGRDRVRERVKR